MCRACSHLVKLSKWGVSVLRFCGASYIMHSRRNAKNGLVRGYVGTGYTRLTSQHVSAETLQFLVHCLKHIGLEDTLQERRESRIRCVRISLDKGNLNGQADMYACQVDIRITSESSESKDQDRSRILPAGNLARQAYVVPRTRVGRSYTTVSELEVEAVEQSVDRVTLSSR